MPDELDTASKVLILNPAARQAEAGGQVIAWAEAQAGCRVMKTQRAGDAGRFAAEAVREGVRCLILAGGDGTISEAVNGLPAFDGVTLGIVPLGTGNDLARCMGVPLDIESALRVIEVGHTEPMDLIRATSAAEEQPKLVVNAASGGFSDVLHRAVNDEIKRMFGPFAYLLAAINAFRKAPTHHVTITCEDQVHRIDACAVMVCNGRYVAGGQELAPEARPDSGRAQLICVSAADWRDRFGVLVRYYLGRHLNDQRVFSREVGRVKVESVPAMRFHADGEPMGQTPLTFEVLAGVLRVCVPAGPGQE